MSEFNFDNCNRNALLLSSGNGKPGYVPKAKKTGTTICGVVYEVRFSSFCYRCCFILIVSYCLVPQGGIVLGADTRATEGDIVADKNCQKIHFISDNIQ